jgi:hypothetical protein
MKSYHWVLFGLFLTVAMAFAYSGGPPDDKCGAPPTFANCTQCHTENPVNSGDGDFTVTLAGLTEYVPGETYSGTVNLSDPDQSRWGFELAVLTNSNEQAGTIVVADAAHTQLSDQPSTNPDFLKHTSSGTYAGSQNAAWEFEWVAPPSGSGTITFYAAGNGANGNGNTSGDFIYTVELAVAEESSSLCPEPASNPGSYQILANYPNPFNPRTVLTFSLEQSGPVRLVIYDVLGRQVASLVDGRLAQGTHHFPFDASSLGTGVYFAHLQQPGGQMMTTLNLVK